MTNTDRGRGLEMLVICCCVVLWDAAELTASADVDMQVAFDNGAAFERLSSIHGVDDLLLTYFITETITSCTEHTGGQTGRAIERPCHFTDTLFGLSLKALPLTFNFLYLSLKPFTSVFYRSS